MFWICSGFLIRFFMGFTTKNKGTTTKSYVIITKKEKNRVEEWLFLCFFKRKNQIVFRDLSTEEDYLLPVDQNPPAPLTEG